MRRVPLGGHHELFDVAVTDGIVELKRGRLRPNFVSIPFNNGIAAR